MQSKSLFDDAQPPPPAGDDEEARQRIRTSLEESLVVEAAAGTGKTTVLVERIVAILQQGLGKVEELAAVTFTRKAAGELKLRLRQQLDRSRRQSQDAEERQRLEEAMSHLEEARIGTIHSFCAEILRERPVEARVDPAFEELSENEAPRLYDQAFRIWIQNQLNDLPEGLRRALTRVSQWSSFAAADSSPVDRLKSVGWQLIEWRDFPAAWERRPFDRRAEIEAVIKPVLEIADLSAESDYNNDYLRKALGPARDFAAWYRRIRKLREPSLDDLEARLSNLTRDLRRDKRVGRGFYADAVSRQQLIDAREALLQRLEEMLQKADADLAACLHQDLQGLVEQYEDLKRRSGKLDFVDLLICVRDLLRGDASVRTYFQRRFSHLFVDEFQDTDPLQAEILMLLAADDSAETDWRKVRPKPGKLFLVGDPKQSIYRFRRADVLLYQEVCEILTGQGVALLHLHKSFRAVAPIQRFVNAAFAPEMKGDAQAGQSDYVAMGEHRPEPEKRPSVVALPVPKPYGRWGVTKRAIESYLPDTIASYAAWLVQESGWTVQDPELDYQDVPIEPRHICILFRRFVSWGQDMTRDYTQGLEARGIPHQLVGARSFHQREEVETLRAALSAIEWPEDELSVFATLKGSFFAIADNLLLRFKLEVGRFHPFRALPLDLDPVFEPVAEALELLKRLHAERNRRPMVETVNELLEATRAHAGFALRPAGNQVLANVQRVCDMARAFEMSGGLSFRGFVEQFTEAAEKADPIAEGPHLEEGAEGVRLMTVHAAKGLEFPVVILADMTALLARNQPDKYVDLKNGLCATRLLGCSPWELLENEDLERKRDQSEGVRIAYVAATRARDLLVVPAIGDEKHEGWLSPLNKALYPPQDARRQPASAPGCPSFGEATVLARSQKHDGGKEFSVKPGLHDPEEGSHQVVWWDPRALKLGQDGDFGVRQARVLAEDPQRQASRQGLQRYQEWKRRRDESVKQGKRPLHEVFTASEVEEGPPRSFDITVEVLKAGQKNRPSGKRFGTLVHTVLRDVDLKAGESAVERLVRLHGRVLGADEKEMRAAVRSVLTALGHDLLKAARAAPQRFRELPVSFRDGQGRLLEGSIDLLFQQEEGWVVVDFKTDAEFKELSQKYRAQMGWYLQAVSKLAEGPVKGWLLGI
ncbi:MAG TPA: UvrD-helicase domain-containing protein [Acidobacteriota bacterium]|nr:UvrD-helicase domain-containing protein [Acidobacteriota bacterium]